MTDFIQKKIQEKKEEEDRKVNPYTKWKTVTCCQELIKLKKGRKKKLKIKTFTDNSIRVRVSNKGVNKDQMITRKVSVRSKDNVTKNRDRKEKLIKNIKGREHIIDIKTQ